MKKIIIAVLLIVGSFSYASAQTTHSTAVQKKTTHTKVVKAKTTASAATPALKEKKMTKTTTSATHLKADGTADKRFKENKTTTTTTGPLKKNGTPDKRFKANKK